MEVGKFLFLVMCEKLLPFLQIIIDRFSGES